MPHIIVEHDKSLVSEVDFPKLLSALHKSLASKETVILEAIKSRRVMCEDLIVGDGSDNQILRVTLLLLKGRSIELRQKMAEDLYEILCDQVDKSKVAVSVNVDELGVYVDKTGIYLK